MKTKHLSLITILFVTLITASCSKPYNPNNLIDDKDKIDIKGSLSNGDMRYPNIEAGYWGKTVYVYFHDYMGECVVTKSWTISNQPSIPISQQPRMYSVKNTNMERP